MTEQSAIPENETVDTGFGDVAGPEVQPEPQPEPQVDPAVLAAQRAAEQAAIKAMAEAEAGAQPALGSEVNQAAEVAAATAAKRLSQDSATFIDLGNGDLIVRTAEGSVRLQPRPPVPVPDTKVELSPRAMTKREAELDAGRRANQHHEAMERSRPVPVKTAAEIASEGRNTPVFRPGEFQEYRDLRAGNVSKDAGSAPNLAPKPADGGLPTG